MGNETDQIEEEDVDEPEEFDLSKRKCKNCTGCKLYELTNKDESKDCKYFKLKDKEKVNEKEN